MFNAVLSVQSGSCCRFELQPVSIIATIYSTYTQGQPLYSYTLSLLVKLIILIYNSSETSVLIVHMIMQATEMESLGGFRDRSLTFPSFLKTLRRFGAFASFWSVICVVTNSGPFWELSSPDIQTLQFKFRTKFWPDPRRYFQTFHL